MLTTEPTQDLNSDDTYVMTTYGRPDSQYKPLAGDKTDCTVVFLDVPFHINHQQYAPNRTNLVVFYCNDLNRPFGVQTSTGHLRNQLRLFKSYDTAFAAISDPSKLRLGTQITPLVMLSVTPGYDLFLERAVLLLSRLYPDIFDFSKPVDSEDPSK